MNVRQRLKLLAILSIVAILSLTLANVYKEYQYMSRLKDTGELVSFSRQISSLMDNLQNERSISSVYIQSRGQYLVNELDDQRKKTDLDISIFNEKLKDYDVYGKNSDILEIVASLKNISTVRSRVDLFNIDQKEMLEYYDGINNHALHIIALNADQSPAGEISKDLSAYYFFLKAKEIASKQKALLSAAFVSGKFSQKTLDKTITYIAKEQSYLDVFENLAPKELISIYKTKENSEVFQDAYTFSQNVISNAKKSSVDIDLESWFGMISKKGDIFKEIDKKAIDKIADDIKQTPTIALYSAIAGVVFLLLILFVIQGINQEISRRIHTFDWIV
jgi:hypothetical protein